MLFARVPKALVLPHVLELVLAFSRTNVYVVRRRFASESRPSTTSDVVSKYSALIRSGQELKPTEAEAEGHNRRLSTFRSALEARNLSMVQSSYYDLVRHQSETAILGRDYQEISWMLKNHLSIRSTPNDVTSGIVEMALRAAANGHASGLKACLLLHLKAGDNRGELSLYTRFQTLVKNLSAEELWHDATATSMETSGGTRDALQRNASGPDVEDLVLIMVTAHAMGDHFDGALDGFLSTPTTIRVPVARVKAFCQAYLQHDVHLSSQVQMWTEELVFLRLVSRESSLNNYISDLGNDKHISSLQKLYNSVISHLNNGSISIGQNSRPRDGSQPLTQRIINMPPDSWGSFLEAFFKCQRQDLVEALWNDVLRLGLTPNRRMWTALLDGYGRQRNLNMAKNVWNRMLDVGVEPDETSYGAMISAYFSASRPTEGFALFQQYRKARNGTAADKDLLSPPRALRLFNIVLHGLCTNAMDDLAFSILKEMVEHGPKPDIVSYNTFLRHYERIGDMKGLAGILKNLQREGVLPDVHSFTTVLSALYKAGKPDAHTKTLQIMKAMDVQPNVATYSAIIHFLVRQGGQENLRKAGELLGQMENEPTKDSRPNEVTYTGLLAGIHRDASLPEENVKMYTAELQNRMRNQGKLPNRVTYHILIKACLENPLPIGLETALQYYREMQKRGIKLLNDTWYVMLAGLLRRGDFAVAQEMLKDMADSGHEPNGALATLISRVHRESALADVRTPIIEETQI